MGVDKQITYDLTQLTPESATALADQFDDIIKQDTKEKKKKNNLEKEIKKEDKERKRKEKEREKLEETKVKDIKTKEIVEDFPVQDIGSQGGVSFFVNQFKSSLPFIGAILLASAFFIGNLLKLDKLEKKFIDIADTRISAFVDRQEQARLDDHLAQTIYTTTAGTSFPRDAYNSFNDYDRILKRDGTERNASTIGGVD